MSRNIVRDQCNHQSETIIFNTASRYIVGEEINEAIPNSNIGKKSFSHFLSAFLMLFLAGLFSLR
jgi:hypothetical protein